MTEIEHLDELDARLAAAFNALVTARDETQQALNVVQTVRRDLWERKVELQRAELSELNEH